MLNFNLMGPAFRFLFLNLLQFQNYGFQMFEISTNISHTHSRSHAQWDGRDMLVGAIMLDRVEVVQMMISPLPACCRSIFYSSITSFYLLSSP